MLYHGIRYPNLDFCPKACSKMKINTITTAREKDWTDTRVILTFRKEIPVSREVFSYTLLSLVAEVLQCLCTDPRALALLTHFALQVGGYLGLTVGLSLYSLLDMKDVVVCLANRCTRKP